MLDMLSTHNSPPVPAARRWVRDSVMELLSTPKSCCQILQSWESWAHHRTHAVYRTGTQAY